MSISIQQLIKELLIVNNDLIRNYFELNQRYQDCNKKGEAKQTEIDRLNNLKYYPVSSTNPKSRKRTQRVKKFSIKFIIPNI